MIRLTDNTIDTAALLAEVSDPSCGAAVLFVGSTREFTGDKQTVHLEYDAYHDMAAKQLHELRDQALDRWPIVGCAIVHRLGTVATEEASIAIAVSSPHRADAFAAGQWLIDTIKEVVPIWKKESWSDGGTEWVHPGTSQAPAEGQKISGEQSAGGA